MEEEAAEEYDNQSAAASSAGAPQSLSARARAFLLGDELLSDAAAEALKTELVAMSAAHAAAAAVAFADNKLLLNAWSAALCEWSASRVAWGRARRRSALHCGAVLLVVKVGGGGRALLLVFYAR